MHAMPSTPASLLSHDAKRKPASATPWRCPLSRHRLLQTFKLIGSKRNGDGMLTFRENDRARIGPPAIRFFIDSEVSPATR